MDDLIRSAGAERVDERASKKLSDLLEDKGSAILERARILADHAGRTKITKEDVYLAVNV
ncbi:histone [Candidatus Micrarchaeota archaeon]|nr:histone [Candidatus Micrarchaeota archaeon]